MNGCRFLAALACIAWGTGSLHAATFNYHGTLSDQSRPADGIYDLELTLYSAPQGGSVVAGPLILTAVPVRQGNFSTQADFGPTPTLSGSSYLSVRIRSHSNSTDDFVSTGSRVFIAAESDSVCPGAWTLGGNAGNPAGSYLGTADNQPLLLEVDSTRVAAAFLTSDGPVPVWLGGLYNLYGGQGGFIGGGGGSTSTDTTNANQVGSFGVVGGGTGNIAGSASVGAATVGGGQKNQATGVGSTIAGGDGNHAAGQFSAVAGGTNNSASGEGASVPGGIGNAAGGNFSLAAGAYAETSAGQYATFVWSDYTASSGSPFAATGANQFLVRATGGVGINTNALLPGAAMTIQGIGASGYGTLVLVPDSNQGPNASNIHEGSNGDWYIRSATGFGTSSNGKVVLQDTGGNVIIGGGLTTQYLPTYDLGLSIVAPQQAREQFITTDPGEADIYFGTNSTREEGAISYSMATQSMTFTTNSTQNFEIDSAGKTFNHSGTWSTFSDARLKRDIATIDHPLETLLQLRGQTFEYRDPEQAMATPGRRMGFIAQQVEEVLPQWVSEDARGYKMITPQGMDALTVEAMRELRDEKDAQILNLQAELRSTQGQLTAVVSRLNKLEGKTEK